MKTLNIVSWAVRLIAAIILIQTVVIYKFPGHPDSVKLFTELGMEPTGRIGTGIAEVIASILILIPGTVWLGAVMVIGLMAGALFFHLTQLGIIFNGDGGTLFSMAILVMLCAVVALLLHRRQIPFLNLA